MIERQVIATWHRPEEKLPEPGEIVIATVSGRRRNTTYDHTFMLVEWYDDGFGWEPTDGKKLNEFVVHAWCDLKPYGMKERV